MSPDRRRYRLSLALNFILFLICIALFFYARNSDQNLAEAQGDIVNSQIQSCRRDNNLRREHNHQTGVIQEILDTIIINSKQRAKLAKERGDKAEERLSNNSVLQYTDYRERINKVALTDCANIVRQPAGGTGEPQ